MKMSMESFPIGREMDGATVTNVQDYDRGVIHSRATLPDGQFLRMTGTFAITRPADRIADDRPHSNRALVLNAARHARATHPLKVKAT